VREEERVAVLDVGLDRLGVDLALRGVGREHHHQVGLGARVERRQHAKPLRLRSRARLGRLGQPDPHVDAGVAERQRVRVALRAVADDGDFAALDEREIRVVVVEDLGGHV
jgi:hypothetical protein